MLKITEKELKAFDAHIRQVVQEELGKLLRGVEVVATRQAEKLAGDRVIKRSFSIPASISVRLDRLGGVASAHVTAALKMYLNLKNEALK